MYEAFHATLSPMLVMFLCLLVGFLLKKTKKLPEGADVALSRLETYALVPAVSFSSFMQYCTVDSLKENYPMVIYASIAILFSAGVAILLSYAFRIKDTYRRSVYQYALAFGNFGFMGNAIVPMILGGDEHLYYYLLFTLPLSFTIYLWGIVILTPKEHRKGSIIKNVFNFPMIAIFAGMFVGISGIGKILPDFFITAVDSLKNCMGPVAMVLAGFVIGGYSFRDMLTDVRVYIASLLRLFVLPMLILFVLRLLGANNYIMTLAFFAFATPLGLNTVVFPAAFGGETKTGASMAMISNVLAVISLPLMYGLLNLWI